MLDWDLSIPSPTSAQTRQRPLQLISQRQFYAIREVRIQVKSCAGPIIGKRERAPGFYRWTVGLGRHKEILIPTDHYDVLALVALGRGVNKITYRIRPEDIHERTSENTWTGITRKFP